MRAGYLLLVAVAILLGSSGASPVAKASGQRVLSQVNLAESTGTVHFDSSRHLRVYPKEDLNDDERAGGIAITNIDDLVDSKRLDAAMKDVTSMKALFTQWNVDGAVSKQIIIRLSADPITFAKYSPLVLLYNGYRAEKAVKLVQSKKVDALVEPAKLDAALHDTTKMKALFKQWDADQAISMQVIERLATDTNTFTKYSALVLRFNSYRSNLLRRAAKAT